jgi:hypothetical protein
MRWIKEFLQDGEGSDHWWYDSDEDDDDNPLFHPHVPTTISVADMNQEIQLAIESEEDTDFIPPPKKRRKKSKNKRRGQK